MLLVVTAFICAVVGIVKPAWPAVGVAVVLICVDLLIK